jgi:hypothetical protein
MRAQRIIDFHRNFFAWIHRRNLERERKKHSSIIRGTSESPRHTWLTRYRCSLPGLAGFAGPRCTEPEVPRSGSRKRRGCREKFNTAPESLRRKRPLGRPQGLRPSVWPRETSDLKVPPRSGDGDIRQRPPGLADSSCATGCFITYRAHFGLSLACCVRVGLHLVAVGVPPQPPCRCP